MSQAAPRLTAAKVSPAGTASTMGKSLSAMLRGVGNARRAIEGPSGSFFRAERRTRFKTHASADHRKNFRFARFAKELRLGPRPGQRPGENGLVGKTTASKRFRKARAAARPGGGRGLSCRREPPNIRFTQFCRAPPANARAGFFFFSRLRRANARIQNRGRMPLSGRATA